MEVIFPIPHPKTSRGGKGELRGRRGLGGEPFKKAFSALKSLKNPRYINKACRNLLEKVKKGGGGAISVQMEKGFLRRLFLQVAKESRGAKIVGGSSFLSKGAGSKGKKYDTGGL